jgi:cathepsin X
MKIIPSLHPFGQVCREIDYFPNATIAEYGLITLHQNHGDAVQTMFQIQAEIFARGPVAATINGKALHNYHSGIFDEDNANNITTHVVSLIGWETDADGQVAYIGRNSWGEYWGERMGFFRVRAGKNMLGVEHRVAWAVPGQYTVNNWPCHEDGINCGPTTAYYKGPWSATTTIQERV